MIKLTVEGDHTMGAYRAEPDGSPKAGLVVLQEIFGLTGHMRQITDEYAERGFLAVAPSLFDRVQPGVVLDYADVAQGRDIMQALDLDAVVADVAAAADSVRSAGKVGAVGYCWGGAIADLAACRTDIDAAVSYYGRMIVEWLNLKPGCPVMYHFGNEDPLIPPETVAEISGGRPDGICYQYAGAGHGFDCNDRPDFHPESAALALERTLAFFDKNL